MHAKTHNQEKKYCCQVCDATFGTRKLFNKHKEGHNQCPHCDLVCQSRTVLTRHLRLHIGGQMDICKGNDDCIKCAHTCWRSQINKFQYVLQDKVLLNVIGDTIN